MEYEMGVQSADDGLDKQKQKSAIKKKAIKFTKIVSLVGLRHATDSRNSLPRRFIWIVWVVFGVVLAIYQIQDRIVYYRGYPSRTEVMFITDEKSLLLPQVTICNDLETAPKMKNTPINRLSEEIDSKLKEMKDAEQKNDMVKKETAIGNLKDLLDQLHNKTQNWEELSKNLSLTADEVIKMVSFNNHENRSLIEEVKTELGHCFAFSTEKHPLYSDKTGAQNGLFLELKADDKSSGFKMLIQDSLVIPTVKDDGITLKPGTVTRVVVSFENVTYLGPPWDSCNIGNPKYRLVNCLTECDYELFSEQCKCRDIHMSGNWTVCSYANILNCTKIFGKQLDTTSSNASTCSCEPTCHSRNYKTSITQTPVSQYEDSVHVYVYYQHMAYMKVENVEAYSLLELLCDIGGALSLLLGATLLTVYEAGEFFLLFIRDYLVMRFSK